MQFQARHLHKGREDLFDSSRYELSSLFPYHKARQPSHHNWFLFQELTYYSDVIGSQKMKFKNSSIIITIYLCKNALLTVLCTALIQISDQYAKCSIKRK